MNPIRILRFIAPLLAFAFLPVSHASPPDADAAKQRVAILRAEIARHDQLYYRDAAPEISDDAYDQLRRELAGLEHRFPALAAAAPRAVGDDRTPGFASSLHREPMLSLDNLYDETALRAWLARTAAALGASGDKIPCTIEPKIDGVAISLIYGNGQLTHAATRGNGLVGDDVTANVIASNAAPLTLRTTPDQAPPALIEIRGEICITHENLLLINQARENIGIPPFASPRNLAAGSIKLHDSTAVASRNLSLVCYGIGQFTPAPGTSIPASQSAMLGQLKEWGLPVMDSWLRAETIDDICAAVTRINTARLNDGLPWPADGVVVKLDHFAGQSRLGATDHAPRWAIACKYRNAFVETRLLGITWQVGRTGVITPVAELAPVTLDGATLTRATLHNAGQIARLDLHIGDAVIIERAGSVIPAIVNVNRDARPPEARPCVFPSACPSCGAALIQMPGESAWRCPASACPAQLQRRLAHFVSKPCMDIPGLGPSRLNDLIQRGLLKSPADLYRLRLDDLAPAAGRAPGKAAHNLLAAIASSKQRPLPRLLLALGIPNIGPAATRALATHFSSIDAISGAAQNNRLPPIDGVSESAAASLRDWFASPANQSLVAELRQLGVE